MAKTKFLSISEALSFGVDVTQEDLTFIAGGILVKSFWHHDEMTNIGTYKFYTINKKDSIRHLLDPVTLSPYVTLKDILLFTKNHLKYLEPLIGNWCHEFCAEGLKNIKPNDGIPNDNAIEYLEIYRILSVQKDEIQNSINGLGRPNFHGIGFQLQKETDGFKIGDRISWAISLSKINELASLPLKVNTELPFYEDHKKIDTYKNENYTLLDIIYAIFWEISFHGGPVAQEKMKDELDQTVNNIRNGTEEVTTIDVEDELDI